MRNMELEQAVDELGDVQQSITYVLFRRERRTLGTDGEQKILRKAANRLRVIAGRLGPNSTESCQEDSHERRLLAERS